MCHYIDVSFFNKLKWEIKSLFLTFTTKVFSFKFTNGFLIDMTFDEIHKLYEFIKLKLVYFDGRTGNCWLLWNNIIIIFIICQYYVHILQGCLYII